MVITPIKDQSENLNQREVEGLETGGAVEVLGIAVWLEYTAWLILKDRVE